MIRQLAIAATVALGLGAVPALADEERPADEPGSPAESLDALAERDLGPAREAEFRDAARQLYAQLGETEQRIVELRLEGYSTDEMAARLGLNPIALRVRMTRLRKRLEETGVLADWL